MANSPKEAYPPEICPIIFYKNVGIHAELDQWLMTWNQNLNKALRGLCHLLVGIGTETQEELNHRGMSQQGGKIQACLSSCIVTVHIHTCRGKERMYTTYKQQYNSAKGMYNKDHVH